jgi:Alpha/beta hydrolase domain containing 18
VLLSLNWLLPQLKNCEAKVLLSRLDGLLGGQLDGLYFKLKNRVFGRKEPAFFSRGWGSDAAIQAVVCGYETNHPPTKIQIAWGSIEVYAKSSTVQDGQFTTPCYSEFMLSETKIVRIKQVLPLGVDKPPMVILLPTTREEGFTRRLRTAATLAQKGIGSILIEGAFLGSRRAPQQTTATLLHLSDFFLLCGSAIEEARSIMNWLNSNGTRHMAVAGVSKGGYIAAAAGATMPFPVAIATIVAPQSGVDVYIEGLTHHLCDWAQLRLTAPSNKCFDKYLDELFYKTALPRIPQPTQRSAIVAIGAKNDRFVPSTAYLVMKTAWPTTELRWLPGGHVSSIFERKHLIKAVCDALARQQLNL